jgi:hypothetical protein
MLLLTLNDFHLTIVPPFFLTYGPNYASSKQDGDVSEKIGGLVI